ncbi:MmcQ/YjbR family DNA-binding protein [Sinomonas sp. G460-2]|uniref:MmcQ/YjbR family DNA-binding protein n=1 Tax=Sinomonas sp. G460-2 TaxID=3393464 RepID=UPI0039F11419
MDADAVRELCLSFPGAYEDYPFGPEVAVYKVRPLASAGSAVEGKMFAAIRPEQRPLSLSLKCDPALAVQLRAAHAEITGAYHMNKKHWNGVRLDGELSVGAVRDMVEDSYDLVVASLPKGQRESLGWSRLAQ